jgi:hypothetical protein
MRELEVQEIFTVTGGTHSSWSIPIYAGAASVIANTGMAIYHGKGLAQSLALGIQFSWPVACVSIILLIGVELSSSIISRIPVPSFQNVPSCHG